VPVKLTIDLVIALNSYNNR